jgi:probable phosphoglycerate mutase
VRLDDRLREIDYGAAEGLSYAALRERFPAVANAWDEGEDAPFPDGEGTQDVLRRARAFLDNMPPGGGRVLAVTHNVVMRALVADVLGLELRKAHRIPIRHLDALDLCRVDGRWHPDWDGETKARLLDGYVGWHA